MELRCWTRLPRICNWRLGSPSAFRTWRCGNKQIKHTPFTKFNHVGEYENKGSYYCSSVIGFTTIIDLLRLCWDLRLGSIKPLGQKRSNFFQSQRLPRFENAPLTNVQHHWNIREWQHAATHGTLVAPTDHLLQRIRGGNSKELIGPDPQISGTLFWWYGWGDLRPQDPQDPQVSHVMVGGPLFGQMEAQKCEASVKLIACLYILYHVYAKSIPLWSCHVKISMIYAMFMPCQCHLTISNRTRISNPLEGPAEPRGALEPIQHLHVSVRALADSDQRLATNRWILAMALA